jgi:SAM-dependent methyltransferase
MGSEDTKPVYVLGSTPAERERVARLAARLSPLTERLFREAGIGEGHRVLDIGSGVGDVAMLVATIVGPRGEVVGVERDPQSVHRARERALAEGFRNVRFEESDVDGFAGTTPFDAAVGRLILQFLPDPLKSLRTLKRLVRPGGVLAFHEPAWPPSLAVAPHLTLWQASATLIQETFHRSGANTEIGLALNRLFVEAGLPSPTMRLEVPLGNSPEFAGRVYDVLRSIRPRFEEWGLYPEALGDFDTLEQRLEEEISSSPTAVPFGVGLVAAWTRIPEGIEGA